MILAIDVGGTSCRLVILNGKKEIVNRFSFSTTNLNKKHVLLQIASNFKKIIEKWNITAIGISSPGAVNSKTGYIAGNSAIENYNNFNLYDDLKKVMPNNAPLPIAMNDANCALLAELRSGCAENYSTAVLLAIGTGLGGAIAINNKIWTGANGFGGEFGYMTGLSRDVDVFDINASLISSITALLKCYESELIKQNKKVPNKIDGKLIAGLADQGDLLAQTAIKNYAKNLSKIIYNIHVGLDPEVFILAGGGSKIPKIDKLTKYYVEQYLQSGCVYNNHVLIKIAKYSNDAGIYGAYFLTKEKL